MYEMATISEALAVAIQHHNAGRLSAAEQIYRQILAVEPSHADAWRLLGVTAYQTGKYETAVEYFGQAIRFNGADAAFHGCLGEAYRALQRMPEAIACYRRALELKPDDAVAHGNWGLALHGQGKLDEAAACYRRALQYKPDYAEAYNNLGLALGALGKWDEAIACYRRALELKPDFAGAQINLGGALADQGKLDDAIACFGRALELAPDCAEGHNNLGNAFQNQGKLDKAVVCFRRALHLKPDYVEARYNLANALRDLGQFDEAIACYRRALELRPGYVEAHTNLGTAWQVQGKLDEAIGCYRRALQLNPGFAEAHNNLGCSLQSQGKLDEAAACFRRALELKPDFAEAHLSRAMAWLLTGDWQRGWPEYQWRQRTKAALPRRFPQPAWDGESLAGKTILLHAEQGLGDTIQFIRYAPIVKQRGAAVIVECQKPLVTLLQGCAGIDRLIARGDPLPPFDLHVPLLSVPGILQTSPETVPAQVPYLFADPVLVEPWRKRLTELDGFKIGINWQGNPGYRDDRLRSFPLRRFMPLAQIPGVRLISLQKGAGAEQLAEVRDLFAVANFAAELDEQSGPFMDTAAVMKNLDLMITSDTAAAHLAGALGVPVWLALPRVPDWRWLLDRCDSPWYPTVRLFRQTKLGDWHGVFREIAQALCQRLSDKAAAGE
jgi:tetratricopeptide (TPR) repeat protein